MKDHKIDWPTEVWDPRTEAALAAPLHWKRRPRTVRIRPDLFGPALATWPAERVFAVLASTSGHGYYLATARPGRMRRWFERVARRGEKAVIRYCDDLWSFQKKHYRDYTQGYTLPSPPTPELRYIYDSACRQEAAALKTQYYEHHFAPAGGGFSGGEYHWRKWPLDNVYLGLVVRRPRDLAGLPDLLATPAFARFLVLDLPALSPAAVQWRVDLYRAASLVGLPIWEPAATLTPAPPPAEEHVE
jgi:hypothetical protein